MSIERNPHGEYPQSEQERIQALSEKLVFSFEGRQNFGTAFEVANSFQDSGNKIRLHRHIGVNMARAGLNPSYPLRFLKNIAERERFSIYTNKREAIYAITSIYLAQKKPQEAFDMSGKDTYYGRPLQPSYDLWIAQGLHELGLDPTPALVRARERMGYISLGGRLSEEDTIGLSQAKDQTVAAEDLLAIAKTTFDLTGQDPKILIDTAKTIIQGLTPSYHKARALSELAKTLDVVYGLDEALAVAKTIKPQEHDQRAETYEALALQRIKKKDRKGATIAAEKRRSPMFSAQINAECAVIAAEQGDNPQDYATQIPYDELLTKYPTGYKKQETLRKLAIIDAALAQAQHLYQGEAFGFYVTRAHRRANEITDLAIKADAYAEMGATLGVESEISKQCFDLSLETALSIMQSPEKLDSLDTVEWLIMTEDLAEFFSKHGHYDLVKQAVERMKQIDTEKEPVDLYFTEVLSDIGRTLAQEGLKQEEIDALSPYDIQAIMNGRNTQAKKAIQHFGLDKKL